MKDCVVLTHHRPDFDELLAYELIKTEGYRAYPGVNTADAALRFYDPEESYPDDTVVIRVGIGGSQFDEHPRNGVEKFDDDECAASLVAKHLGVSRKYDIYPLLSYARRVDGEGESELMELSAVVKTMYRSATDSEAIRFGLQAIRAYRRKCWAIARHDSRPLNVVREEECDVQGRNVKIAEIHDDFGFTPAMRSRYDIVILHRTPGKLLGNVQIYLGANAQGKINMGAVARGLRLADGMKSGWVQPPSNFDEKSEAPGVVLLSPAWHYFKKLETISNGNEKHPFPEETHLTKDEIWDAVTFSLSWNPEPVEEDQE